VDQNHPRSGSQEIARLVEQERHHAHEGRLLSAVLARTRREHTANFAHARAAAPKRARRIEESLHLRGGAAKASAGAKDDDIGVRELSRVGNGDVRERFTAPILARTSLGSVSAT
jgi:hypothetical protein